MLNRTFIYRQLRTSRQQTLVFILCVALSIVTLVALNGFRESINAVLLRDARALQAGDIIINGHQPLTPALESEITNLLNTAQIDDSTQLYQFYSVVRVDQGEATLLSDLKSIDPQKYPFYGQIMLESGQSFAQTLQPGTVIVDQNLLDRLNMTVDQNLVIGQRSLKIVDVVTQEPDRPVNLFAFGPRIFIHQADLDSLDLIKPGSRVEYTTLLKVSPVNRLESLAEGLRQTADNEPIRVRTYRSSRSGVERFFDNFLFFLSLIGIFTLLLAGIGIQSSLTAYLKEREKTIAVVKTMGATSRFITLNYYVVVGILGSIGTVLGLLGGLALQYALPNLFADFLPPNVELLISGRVLLESLLLGSFVVFSFTFLPLYNLQDLRPSFIFRKEVTHLVRGWPYYATILIIFAFFVGMMLWQLRSARTSGYFIAGVLGLIALSAFITEVVLRLLRRRKLQSLAARQALRGLFRPRNATRAIVITLSASLAVVFTIYLIQQNLNAALIESYPEDAPNVFMVDIQPDQVAGLQALLPLESKFFPVIRASVDRINGQIIDREAERERWREQGREGDNLAREFNVSYDTELLDTERLVAGESLFDPTWAGPQVSVLDEFFEEKPFTLGDTVLFDVQGVPLEARVVSLRERTMDDSPQPFFTFLFRPEDLGSAPQTIFTAFYIDPEAISQLQNEVVAAYPNVTVINIASAIATVADIAARLSRVIRFLTLFSIAAGLLIIVSSVLATRFARIQESVYFKVLGATRRFVLQVFALENIFLGLLSAFVALLMAQTGSWIISHWVFEIDYNPFLGASTVLVLATTALVTAIGLLASISILHQKPITFLRENTQE